MLRMYSEPTPLMLMMLALVSQNRRREATDADDAGAIRPGCAPKKGSTRPNIIDADGNESGLPVPEMRGH